MLTCYIKWDGSYSYKLANSNNNFSIIDVQGTAQKLIWDGGGTGKEHIINNPNNYSYSIIQDIVCKIYNVKATFSYTKCPQGVVNSGIVNYGNFRNPHNFRIFYEGNGVMSSCGYKQYPLYLHFNYHQSSDATCNSNPVLGGNKYQFGGGTNASFNITLTPQDGIDLYNIKIIDNSVTYTYSITNKNSVEVIYNQGGKKIQIEGNQYDIIDANSAYKDCDKHCPNGLIECQCGNQLCCYKKTNSGYELVQTINL